MPSSDDDDKKKRGPVPLARAPTASEPGRPERSEVTRSDASGPDIPPGEATAELSQEQLDALPVPQRRDPTPSATQPPHSGSVTSDAWGSFEDNNAWLSTSQTGRRMRPQSTSGAHDMPPTEALSDPGIGLEEPGERIAPARLVSVQADGGKRQEFSLRRARVAVGRGSTNQIVIDNPSVSREHGRFTFGRGQWTVHDLQSGNGVFVNQQRISGARGLRHGDEIMFGQTVWHFAVESVGIPLTPTASGSVTQAPLPQAEGHRGRLLTTVLLLGVVALGVALVLPQVRGRIKKKKEIDPNAAAFVAFQEGIAAFKQHKWDVAEHNFAKVTSLSPQEPMVQRLQKAMERERSAEQQLQQAHEAQHKGDMVAAYQLTQGVLDSTFRHEAQSFLAELQGELDTRVKQAHAALESGALARAKELLQVVEEAQPGRPDVTIMQVRMALRSSTPRTPVHLATLGKNRQMPSLSGPTAVAVRYFIDGDVPKALQMFDSLNSEEAATLRQAVQRFSDAYDAGLAEYHAKRPNTAIRFFGQAKAEEARIGHGQCKLLSDIDHKLADMYYIQGVQQFTAGSFPASYQSLHQAITLVPTHVLASRKLLELDQKAQDILTGAGVTRASRAQLQQVLQIVPVGSELYRKAKSRLDALP